MLKPKLLINYHQKDREVKASLDNFRFLMIISQLRQRFGRAEGVDAIHATFSLKERSNK